MDHDLTPLKLDLVEWVANAPRLYREVMEVWRTSCPRLPIWEDCVDDGLLFRHRDPARGDMVGVTEKGHTFLAIHGRSATDPAIHPGLPPKGRPRAPSVKV